MNTFTLLDGGMGRELLTMGAPFKQPEWSALALMEAPGFVRKAHDAFIMAGADVITTNTYAIVPFHIGNTAFIKDGRKLIKLAAEIARHAADEAERNVQVAGCIPPLFGSYEPQNFDETKAGDIIAPLIEEQKDQIDCWLLETTSSISEARFACRCLYPTEKPIWISYTLTDRRDYTGTSTLRSGEATRDAITFAMEADGVEAVLFNCSGPEEMEDAIAIGVEVAGKALRIGCYANSFSLTGSSEIMANAGLSDIRMEITPEVYLHFAKKWKNAGASIIGGCCGIRPAHIKTIHETLR
ncbi:MAG: homocysteine S-methyltransferase family protein [Desulfopila sp.]|jgi:S-methylmethionine-dependent homocysteine/selenocysteine methylase|nr:homocysteine S-methyltransferase family protein [Desulfopila sp.]